MLLKRGRWQLHHDWMSTSGGLYPTEDSYLQLTFQMFHWDGLSFSISVMGPGIGDVWVQVQNKRSVESNKRSPYFYDRPRELQYVSWTRRSIQEIKDIERENAERDRRHKERMKR